jgi:hypothetical protein
MVVFVCVCSRPRVRARVFVVLSSRRHAKKKNLKAKCLQPLAEVIIVISVKTPFDNSIRHDYRHFRKNSIRQIRHFRDYRHFRKNSIRQMSNGVLTEMTIIVTATHHRADYLDSASIKYITEAALRTKINIDVGPTPSRSHVFPLALALSTIINTRDIFKRLVTRRD